MFLAILDSALFLRLLFLEFRRETIVFSDHLRTVNCWSSRSVSMRVNFAMFAICG